jgi:hypothetical protein
MRDLADASASAASSLSSLDDDGSGVGLTCGAHIDRTLERNLFLQPP